MKAIVNEKSVDDFKKEVKKMMKKFRLSYSIEIGDPLVIDSKTVHDPVDDTNVIVSTIGREVAINIDEFDKLENTGYTYLGCIKNEDVVTVHPSAEAGDFSLSSLEDEIKEFPCHSCHKRITRNIIHVFRDKDGSVRVFGSSCAKTAFGVDFKAFIEKFKKIENTIANFSSANNEEGFDCAGGSCHTYCDSRFLSKVSYHNIKAHGYISASSVYGADEPCTRDYVLVDIGTLLSGKRDAWMELKSANENDPFDFDDFVEFSKNFTSELNGDFGFNMKAVHKSVVSGHFPYRMVGFLVYLVSKYVDSKREKVLEFNEDHSYNKGDKVHNLKVKVVDVKAFNSMYGECFLHIMAGVDDNVKYKWFTNKHLEGDVLITSGSVKELEDHPKFGKSVVLTRCRVK